MEDNNNEREDKKTLYKAFIKAQNEFGKIVKDAKNPYFNSKYLTLEALIEVVRNAFGKNGLGFSQEPTTVEINNKIYVQITTQIYHESGAEFPPKVFLMPLSQTKLTEQAIGSAITYAKRYALQSIVGISADEDDDGNSASGRVVENKQYTKPQQQVKKQENKHCCKCGQVIENRPLGNTTYFDYSLKELGDYYCKECGQARKKEIETGQKEMVVT